MVASLVSFALPSMIFFLCARTFNLLIYLGHGQLLLAFLSSLRLQIYCSCCRIKMFWYIQARRSAIVGTAIMSSIYRFHFLCRSTCCFFMSVGMLLVRRSCMPEWIPLACMTVLCHFVVLVAAPGSGIGFMGWLLCSQTPSIVINYQLSLHSRQRGDGLWPLPPW